MENKSEIIFQENVRSLSDFGQIDKEKEIDKNFLNNYNKQYEFPENDNSNSEHSSDSSNKNTGIINPIIIPNQKLTSKIQREKHCSDTDIFNERNDYYSKDEYLEEYIIKQNNEINKGNTSKIINNNETNTNYSTNFDEKKEENTMEIEEKDPNENSFKKRFDDIKEIMPKMNLKNNNLEFNQKEDEEDEEVEEDKN